MFTNFDLKNQTFDKFWTLKPNLDLTKPYLWQTLTYITKILTLKNLNFGPTPNCYLEIKNLEKNWPLKPKCYKNRLFFYKWKKLPWWWQLPWLGSQTCVTVIANLNFALVDCSWLISLVFFAVIFRSLLLFVIAEQWTVCKSICECALSTCDWWALIKVVVHAVLIVLQKWFMTVNVCED